MIFTSIIFNSNFFEKFHVNLKLLFDVLHDNIKFHWDNELETLFRQIKLFIREVVILTVPNTNQSFFATVFLLVIGCVLFELKDEAKRDGISYISRNFTANEQKLSNIYRELSGIAYSPTIYHIVISFYHFITVLKDKKPIFSCFTKKRHISAIFYTAEMQIIKFQKLRIIYTEGKSLL